MASSIPKVKKAISSFLLGEEGKISKQSILSMGLFLGTVALATAASSDEAAGWHGNVHRPAVTCFDGYRGSNLTVIG